VGSDEEMKKFDATIKFFNSISGEEISSRGRVVSIEKSVQEIIEENQELYFSDERCKRLMNNGKVDYCIRIVERQ
jgi:hypothetical protein